MDFPGPVLWTSVFSILLIRPSGEVNQVKGRGFTAGMKREEAQRSLRVILYS
ncbi:MAG TPA: hypothetical protein VEI46_06815 [Thermodesulfovibrionales bacterium]|nr:hypothetical protein [Thermodesulfovibrionales bacterium]